MSHTSTIASSFGLSDAISATAEERALVKRLDAALSIVERDLATTLQFDDAFVDTVARYLLEAGGKRVRPLLALLAAEYGDPSLPAVNIAAQTLEIVHLATLYHDDVMDDADLRRGVDTAHIKWGNSVAIITGDLLLARASQLAASLGSEMVSLQASTFERLTMGQFHETTGPRDGDPIAHYLQVLADKTGSLIASSAIAGLMASGAPAEYIEPLRQFGERIGVAFQLIDDILDLDGGETGKVKGTDVRHGVVTLPILYLTADGGEDAVALNERLRAAIASGEDSEFESAVDELRASRFSAMTIDEANRWAESAIEALEPLPDTLSTRALRQFARRVIERNS